MKSNLNVIIAREFSERVAKKSFIITTLLMPLLMVVMMVAPALIMKWSTPESKTIAVADSSGVVIPVLADKIKQVDYIKIVPTTLPVDTVMADDAYDGILVVGSDIVAHPANATFYTRDNIGVETESLFGGAITDAVEAQRLLKYNIDNLGAIMDEVKVDTTLNVLRYEKDSEGKSISSAVSMGLGIVMTFILYMFLLMYGQMVMTSIIEEKNNRVLELVVSSVKPTQLMLGKILGVGLVAVVQIVIWAVLMCMVSGLLLPLLIPAEMSEQISMFNAGSYNAATSTIDPETVKAMAMFTSVGYIAKIFLYLLLFLVGGFLFYASIFAAIGSAVDNVQDASQLQTFAILPIILAFLFSLSIANNPNGTAAVWMSMIPFTSPMVMLSRIAFDVSGWQVWLSLIILYASFVGMAWISGKIYRVGIFMYGKKPNIKDLIRWARYK